MNKKVLIIDDDPGILEVTQIVLEEAGYSVKAIDNAEIVEAELEKDLPDVILLDVLLSGVEGQEVAKKIKANEKTKHIPIIMMSANASIEEKMKEAHAQDYIKKPFDIEMLEEIVKKYIGKH